MNFLYLKYSIVIYHFMKKLYATPRKHFEECCFHGKYPWDLIDIMVSLFFMLLPELIESNTSASMFLLLGAFAITAVTLA